MSDIEKSNQRNKFTPAEIRAKAAASKKFWSSPEGLQAATKQAAEKRGLQLPPTKFPSLASRGTKPVLSVVSARKSLYRHL